MMPKDTGDAIGRRELTAAGEQTTYDIQFTGLLSILLVWMLLLSAFLIRFRLRVLTRNVVLRSWMVFLLTWQPALRAINLKQLILLLAKFN